MASTFSLRLLVVLALVMVAAVNALPAKTRSQAQDASPMSMQLKQKLFLESIEGNYKTVTADVKESRNRRAIDNREIGQIDLKIELDNVLVDLVLHENVDLHASSATHCHFVGHVKDREDWTAALSTCLGLTGFVNYNGETYVIEGLLNENGEHTAHSAVYKSSHRKIGECAAATSADMDTTSSVKTKDSAAATDSHAQNVEQETATKTRPLGVKRRRAVGGTRYIELAIVLDQLAVGIYGSNAQTYVLTVVNQVSALFKNGKFDYDMVFQVVTIRSIADNNAAGFTSGSTSVLLSAMSGLQSSMGVSYDVAALIYGGDIFQGSSTAVAGVANVGVVCRNPNAAVSASEEDGLFATALIMAHEMGHNFNLQHDSAACLATETNTQGIMAASSGPSASPFFWSTCSRSNFNAFVASLTCLSNSATNALPGASNNLPGASISMDKQCQLQYGASSSFCTWCYGGSEPSACSRLWCNMDGGSAGTHYSGLLEGTICPIGNSYSNGLGVCNNGACVSSVAATTTASTTTTSTTTTTKATTTSSTTTKATTTSTTTKATTTSTTTTTTTTRATTTSSTTTTTRATTTSAALGGNLLRNGDFDTCSNSNLPDSWTMTDIKNAGDAAELGCQTSGRGVDGGRWLNGGQSSRFSQLVTSSAVVGTTYTVRVSLMRAGQLTAVASVSLSAGLDGNAPMANKNIGVTSTLWSVVELQYKATSSGPLYLHLASFGNMAGSVVGWDKAQVTAAAR